MCVMMQQALSEKYCFCINLQLKSAVAYKHSALIDGIVFAFVKLKNRSQEKLGDLPKASQKVSCKRAY